jgi:sterol desaturase/sphingolipid hydroxylase (fatty acid hydroxylase superfamily)
MSFFEHPYDTLFAHKMEIFAVLMGLTLGGLALDYFGKRRRNPWETFSNMVIFGANNSVNLLWGQALQFATLSWLERFAPVHLPTNAYTLAACFLGLDFCYYWRHRWEHEINFLWAEHNVHHSSEEYNFATSLRLPVITPLFGWVFFIPLVLVGFNAKLVMASFFLDLLYQYWVHNDTIGKLPLLDQFLATPSNHRVHHARNPEYLDKNYGGVFIFWDKLFGTYEPERAKPEFGIVHPIGTRNPVLINTRPYARLIDKAAEQRSLRGKLRAVFGRPA